MNTIRIVAEMTLKAGAKEALMPVLATLVEGSRAEAGNIQYELVEDLDNPQHLLVIETWASEKAIAEHNATPHFTAFVKAIEGKAETLTVTKGKKIL